MTPTPFPRPRTGRFWLKAALVGCLCLAACAEFPDTGVTARAVTGPAPQLVPIDGLLRQADTLRPAEAAVGDIRSRAAALRARAALLRKL